MFGVRFRVSFRIAIGTCMVVNFSHFNDLEK